jgi:hypothetical protein
LAFSVTTAGGAGGGGFVTGGGLCGFGRGFVATAFVPADFGIGHGAALPASPASRNRTRHARSQSVHPADRDWNLTRPQCPILRMVAGRR